MAIEKNCGTCRYGLKPMNFPECIAERCDENYSNWTPDAEDGLETIATGESIGSDVAGEVS